MNTDDHLRIDQSFAKGNNGSEIKGSMFTVLFYNHDHYTTSVNCMFANRCRPTAKYSCTNKTKIHLRFIVYVHKPINH